MWVSYFNAQVAVHEAVDGLSRRVVDCLAITSILRTAPRRINARFHETSVALLKINSAILVDVWQLRNIRLTMANFRDFPVLTEARVRVYRIVQAEKILQIVRTGEEQRHSRGSRQDQRLRVSRSQRLSNRSLPIKHVLEMGEFPQVVQRPP
jgi:hypothetical protein